MDMIGRTRRGMVEIPSLVDLCVQTAIDNVRYIGDVGETDLHLLEHILPHCTLQQLEHIENSTEGRDLSSVTDKLWKKFYEIEFGAKSVNVAVENMKRHNKIFQWKALYKVKLEAVKKDQEESFNRIKQLYKKEDARKQSRQVQLCTKVPPSSNKRSFNGGWGPGSSIGNSKSSLMKKSKLDLLKSQEVKNLTALKRNAVQKSYSPLSTRKPSGFSQNGASSTSKNIKPFQRRC